MFRRNCRPLRKAFDHALIATLTAACLWSLGCSEDSAPAPTERSALEAEFEAVAKNLEASDAGFFGNAPFERLLSAVERQDLQPGQRLQVLVQLAAQHLRRGETDAALDRLAEAEALIDDDGPTARARPRWLRFKAMSHLRQAEEENCLLRRSQEACIFPLRGGGVHDEPGPALAARDAYDEYLRMNPGDGTAVWLINVLSMAVGDYPEGVPEYFRIPPEAFASAEDIGQFDDIAPALGIDTLNNCGGVITDDFDGDGLLDIVTSTWHPRGALTFYRNGGDGTFTDRSAASGLDQQWGGLNLISADYDDDGDLDILVLRGAWLFQHGQIRNSLLRNDGDGTFTDVTREAGLADPPRPTQAATWGDFDNDGDLDLYIANERAEEGSQRNFPAQLFDNQGDGTFVDVAADAGVLNDGHGKGVTVGDFDNDGDLDLYVSNIGPNRLYENQGDGRFVDVAAALGVEEPSGRSFASWFFDYDNDGWLDLFVTAYQGTVADVAADLASRGGPPVKMPAALFPRLYRNLGGRFADVTVDSGLQHVYMPMGANFGDLDNDGWLDMYLSTGDPSFETLTPNVMLRNQGGRRFVDITASSGLGHLQKGHGVAFADLDNDGDQDLYHQLGGFVPGDRYHNALFLNRGHGHRYLTVELRGRTSNRRGVGARLHLQVEGEGGMRSIHRAAGSVSSFGGSPLRQEIGLGRARSIRRLEVWWPTSATRQSFSDIPLDATLRIVEGAEAVELLSPPSYDLATVLDGRTSHPASHHGPAPDDSDGGDSDGGDSDGGDSDNGHNEAS